MVYGCHGQVIRVLIANERCRRRGGLFRFDFEWTEQR